MGRISNGDEGRREVVEGCLGRLGNALVYLRLVSERVQFAARMSGQDALLGPALEDCHRAQVLIRAVQVSIGARAGDSFSVVEKSA